MEWDLINHPGHIANGGLAKRPLKVDMDKFPYKNEDVVTINDIIPVNCCTRYAIPISRMTANDIGTCTDFNPTKPSCYNVNLTYDAVC